MKNESTVDIVARKARSFVALCAGLLALTACGNLTGGGFGEAAVVVSGDHEPPPPAPAMVASEGPAATSALVSGPALADEPEEPEGEVEIDMQLFLVDDLGRSTQLGGDEVRVKVDLQGVVPEEAARRLVAAVHYSELRVIFTKIQAEVEAGLVIDGVPILGEVHVELEDVHLEVVRPIDIDLLEGETVELVLDLNAPAWLAAVNPITRTVDETVFAALVSVAVD
jgi:hypothetical protein